MTSCVVQVQELSRRLLKRVRPSLPAAAEEPRDSEALLKVSKRQVESSPRSAAAAATVASMEPTTPEMKKAAPAELWPSVTGCDGVRRALTFLQNSRQHAMMLMLQNHWERAMGVLEKIEKATESVCRQRREVVLQQANAGRSALVDRIKELELSTSASSKKVYPTTGGKHRGVRFSDEVSVGVAADMDRSVDQVSEPVREEMLVLRASRKIPQENLSEFWNE